MSNYLLVDYGSTNTKITAVNIEKCEIIGTAKSFTTVEEDISIGFNNALKNLFNEVGEFEYEKILACSSAAGGLRIVAIGLVKELTAKAARLAAFSAGAKVIKTFCNELTLEEINEIEEIHPEIILLTGGTNGGNKEVAINNYKKILKMKKSDIPVIFAGNKCCTDEIRQLAKDNGREVVLTENVMPEFNELNISPAQNAIREVFLNRIIKAKGFTKVSSLIDGILMPTPAAVLAAAQLLSKGTENEKGFGELMIIDVGGATTDVYSIGSGNPTLANVIYKGLPEPFAKRTVEGDLGVRYTVKFLLEESNISEIASLSGISEDEVGNIVEQLCSNPELLPGDLDNIDKIDFALASQCLKIASDRHSGEIEKAFTSSGQVYIQTGKDLTNINKVIGTGGSIINATRQCEIINNVLLRSDSNRLKPKKATIYLDKFYILSAMGLLADTYPEVAIRILKKEIKELTK